MDDDNWFTVGKPKKIKTGEKKIEIGENGKKIEKQQFALRFWFSRDFYAK